jgi:hypothetical protein
MHMQQALLKFKLEIIHKQHLIAQTLQWSADCQTHHMHVMQVNQLHASC